MLPINTQASSTEDRHIIAASLKRQEEEAYKQTKILEKLADEFGKQRRASVKQNTNKQAETSTKGPGFFDMPLQDLKQMFVFDSGYKNKQNKQNTLKDIPQTLKFDSGQKSNNKQDTNKDENSDKKSQGVFKNMIENITDSNAKKEISETRKKLDNIVETPSEGDKVKKSIETAQEPPAEDKLKKSSDMENEETTQTERKLHVPFSQKIKQSFSEKMTNSMAGATTKDFSQLLTTKEYKEFTKKQTDRIVDALEGLDIGGGGGSGGIGVPGLDVDLPDGKDGKKNQRGRVPKPGTPKPGTPKPGTPKPGMPKLPGAKFGARMALGAVAGTFMTGITLATHMEELGANEAEEMEKIRQLEKETREAAGEPEPPSVLDIANDPNIPEGDARKLEARKRLENQTKVDSDVKKYGKEEAGDRALARQKIEENLRQRKEEKDEIRRIQSRSKILPKTETNKATEAGPQEDLVIPDELKNLETASAVTPKLLDTATEQKQELEDTKAATAPITVINNNTNNVGGGGGQSMSFASASAVNLDTAINDFFRSHGRIFA